MRVFVFALVSLLAGCNGLPEEVPNTLPPDYVPADSGQKGIVIGSVTSPPSKDLNWQEWSRYNLRAQADPKIVGSLWSGSDDMYGRFAIPFAYRRYPDYKGCAEEPGLENECGRLFAMELPPGDYEIWQVSVSVDSSAGTWTVDLPDYRFAVAADTITYIGNLNDDICVGSFGLSNVIILVGGDVYDKYARDLALLVAKYPFLSDRSIKREPIRAEPWQRRRWKNREPDYGWEVCDREAAN